MTDPRLHFEATARNRAPILEVLRARIPPRSRVLEVASGSGEHGCHFCANEAGWEWQPTDMEPAHLASIEAWRQSTGLPNLRRALRLDCTQTWPAFEADALFCANLIHIAPWEVALGVFAGAQVILKSGAPLILYGPFMRDGQHTAPSNADFDSSLRARDPRWGVRGIEAVAEAANGFVVEAVVPMPANNFCLCLRRV